MARNQPKIIVLTGATRGLGVAMVEKFVELGHTVLGCGRSREAIEMLRARFRPPHDFAALDVSLESQVEPWAARLLSSHGVPDILINNAGVINQNAPLWQVPADEFDRVFDVNVKGVANVIRHFVPAMIARKAGLIINFSSTWGRTVSSDVAPYCASKWAIEGLTQALAEELPRGMAAIPLNPGIIDTDMLRSCLGGTAGPASFAGQVGREGGAVYSRAEFARQRQAADDCVTSPERERRGFVHPVARAPGWSGRCYFACGSCCMRPTILPSVSLTYASQPIPGIAIFGNAMTPPTVGTFATHSSRLGTCTVQT